MGRGKKYSGYASYQYLTPRTDYKKFDMAKQVGRVESHVVPLDKNQEDKAEDIISKNLMISLHDHAMVFPDKIEQTFDYFRTGRIVTGFEGLSLSGMDAFFDNMTDGVSRIVSKNGWKMDDVIYELGMRYSDFAHQDFLIKCERASDIERAHKEGKIALIPTLESASPIENEVDRVDILYGLGIRSMGLVYSEANMLGSGRGEKSDGGLTNFGEEVVNRMNKLGMLIDVAHCGNKTSMEAMEASKEPIVISHCTTGASSSDSISNPRPDEVFNKLADRKGVAGMMVAGTGSPTIKHPQSDVESYMEHVVYLSDLIGIDHVAMGPDVLFGDHVGLYKIWFPEVNWEASEKFMKATEGIEYVKGMESSVDFPNIVRWLVKNGYSDQEIAKIAGGNVMRVLKKVWY